MGSSGRSRNPIAIHTLLARTWINGRADPQASRPQGPDAPVSRSCSLWLQCYSTSGTIRRAAAYTRGYGKHTETRQNRAIRWQTEMGFVDRYETAMREGVDRTVMGRRGGHPAQRDPCVHIGQARVMQLMGTQRSCENSLCCEGGHQRVGSASGGPAG